MLVVNSEVVGATVDTVVDVADDVAVVDGDVSLVVLVVEKSPVQSQSSGTEMTVCSILEYSNDPAAVHPVLLLSYFSTSQADNG